MTPVDGMDDDDNVAQSAQQQSVVDLELLGLFVDDFTHDALHWGSSVPTFLRHPTQQQQFEQKEKASVYAVTVGR